MFLIRRDLRDQPPVWWDMQENPPLPCNDLYCGAGSQCATTTVNIEGCVCRPGTVARAVDRPNLSSAFLGQGVTCVSLSFDLMPEMPDDAPDVCAGWSCGEAGECVALNGSPTCACNAGYAAVPQFGNPLLCRAIVESYPATQLLWPGFNDPFGDDPKDKPEEDDLPEGCADDSSEDDDEPELTESRSSSSRRSISGSCNAALGGRSASLLVVLFAGLRRRRTA